MNDKLWAGRFEKKLNSAAEDINSSIRIDSRMYRQDIEGSVAHAKMLGAQGIVAPAEAQMICDALKEILHDIEAGSLEIDMACEDIHTFVEAVLTARIGDTGKKLHTARSRNDQVAVDTRLYLRERADGLIALIKKAVGAITELAEANTATIMPGYTHLQRAQPVSFAHDILAFASMLLRDASRIADCRKRMNVSPLGSCALAGTTFDTDRFLSAKLLGFDAPCINSIDGVSDRDFILELASCCSICAMHLSRLCEELIMYCSWEFGFIEFDDSFTTGSSIMPQKKNPDIAELIRGKCGRVYGSMMTLFTMLKSLPLAYNKDMQEDKEAIFDCVDTLQAQLGVLTPMLKSIKVKKDKMRKAAAEGFINATDLADYLVRKGLPFRTAYKLCGEIVAYCIKNEKTLETLTFDEYKGFSELFGEDVKASVSLDSCLSRRNSYGGTSPEAVGRQIEYIKKELETV
ncbi:MAG TPA: argininosuccinate lyase [Bacillota bacterium]|nr:argininosuccinate lyase [Bacillota bacterium]